MYKIFKGEINVAKCTKLGFRHNFNNLWAIIYTKSIIDLSSESSVWKEQIK